MNELGGELLRLGQDFVVEWQPRDIFLVPSWRPVTREADGEAVLFSFRKDRHDA